MASEVTMEHAGCRTPKTRGLGFERVEILRREVAGGMWMALRITGYGPSMDLKDLPVSTCCS